MYSTFRAPLSIPGPQWQSPQLKMQQASGGVMRMPIEACCSCVLCDNSSCATASHCVLAAKANFMGSCCVGSCQEVCDGVSVADPKPQ